VFRQAQTPSRPRVAGEEAPSASPRRFIRTWMRVSCIARDFRIPTVRGNFTERSRNGALRSGFLVNTRVRGPTAVRGTDLGRELADHAAQHGVRDALTKCFCPGC